MYLSGALRSDSTARLVRGRRPPTRTSRQAKKIMKIGSSRKRKPAPLLFELEPPVTTHPPRTTEAHNAKPRTTSRLTPPSTPTIRSGKRLCPPRVAGCRDVRRQDQRHRSSGWGRPRAGATVRRPGRDGRPATRVRGVHAVAADRGRGALFRAHPLGIRGGVPELAQRPGLPA